MLRHILLVLSVLSSLTVFGQNRFPVPIDGKFGFIDRKGKLVIPAVFEEEAEFHNGLALIKEKDFEIKVIDTTGNIIFNFKNPNSNYWVYPNQCEEGLLAVYDHYSESYGFIDTKGKIVIEPKYYEVLDFSDGLAGVWEDADIHVDTFSGCGTAVTHAKWGFINKTGEYVIQPNYYEVSEFINGYAIANDKFIDQKGTIVSRENILILELLNKMFRYDGSMYNQENTIRYVAHNIENFEDCLIMAQNSNQKWGFLNYNGVWTVQSNYFGAQFFSDGYAGIKDTNGKWGYIDCSGKIIVEPLYNFVYFFSEGLGAVQKGGKWGFINTKGEVVIPFLYDERRKFKNGLVKVEKNKKVVYLNKQGVEVWTQR
jgi:hypothetical protein